MFAFSHIERLNHEPAVFICVLKDASAGVKQSKTRENDEENIAQQKFVQFKIALYIVAHFHTQNSNYIYPFLSYYIEIRYIEIIRLGTHYFQTNSRNLGIECKTFFC